MKEGMGGTKEGVDVAGLGNLFEHLEVDEPPEWTSNNLPPKSTKNFDTYELEPTNEDLSFAIFCLFKDLTDIRHYVRQTVSETQHLTSSPASVQVAQSLTYADAVDRI
jgi:hypothetical protein